MRVVAELAYEKIRQIGVGQGANSAVFEAREENVNRPVAVKEIDKADLSVRGIYDYFAEAKTMFRVRHPHVVPIYTAVQRPDIVALLMPLYSGGSLADQIKSGPLRLSLVLDVAHGVLEGLAHIHIQGFLHFDIKPSNVLFTVQGKPLVADFGQTRMLDKSGVAGAPSMYPYAPPPETFRLGGGLVQSDIFQMGLLLYRCVNGDPFYQDMKARQLARYGDRDACLKAGRIVDPAEYLPHVPHAMRRIIRKALDVRPENRYPTAQSMQDALARVALKLDWEMRVTAQGMSWTASRKGRTGLLVEKSSSRTPGRWDVRVYTTGTAGRRAVRRDEFWAEELTERQAEQHLRTKVFTPLERA